MKIIMPKCDLLGNIISDTDRFWLSSILYGVVTSFCSSNLFLENEPIFITNNSSATSPVFYSKVVNPFLKYDKIVLNCAGLSYWCQVIFQLSHELAHCVISRINDGSRNNIVSWIEETVCEATSLYCLKWFSEHWLSIPSSNQFPSYSSSIKTYLNDFLAKGGTGKLSNCRSYFELEEINHTSEDRREDRRQEMCLLYSLIQGDDLLSLFSYRSYLVDGTILLDTDTYSNAFPSIDAVQYLCSLQNSILDIDRP